MTLQRLSMTGSPREKGLVWFVSACIPFRRWMTEIYDRPPTGFRRLLRWLNSKGDLILLLEILHTSNLPKCIARIKFSVNWIPAMPQKVLQLLQSRIVAFIKFFICYFHHSPCNAALRWHGVLIKNRENCICRKLSAWSHSSTSLYIFVDDWQTKLVLGIFTVTNFTNPQRPFGLTYETIKW